MSGLVDNSPQTRQILPAGRGRRDTFSELLRYRELLGFLTWRSVKVRYAQSALGVGWAVIQPVAQMVVYTVIFGSLVGVQSDGAPYAVFTFVALVPWTFFANALTQATQSLPTNSALLSKVYFPRLVLPLSEIGARSVDFLIALAILVVLVLSYGIVPNWGILMLPIFILIMLMASAGLGLVLSALAIQYRDVNHAATFGVQLLMYAAPVVYSYSIVPERYRLLYALNPMVGVVEGFRAAFLGTRAMPWTEIGIGAATAFLLLLLGGTYFKRREHLFADVG